MLKVHAPPCLLFPPPPPLCRPLPSVITLTPNQTMQLIMQGSCLVVLQDSRTKSQGVSVTAFQSVPADEGLSPAPSLLAGRLPSMDADMAQAIQLSLAGACALRRYSFCATWPILRQSNQCKDMVPLCYITDHITQYDVVYHRAHHARCDKLFRVAQGVLSQHC